MTLDQPANQRNIPDELRMSLGDHLEDLRWRLILALAGVVVATLIALLFGRPLIAWLLQPLMQVQHDAGLPTQAHFFSPTSPLTVLLKVGLIAGLIVASPWVLFQLWKFVEAGLYPHERKAIYLLAPFSALMSLLAVGFMYYIILPISLYFLIFFSAGYPAPEVRPAEERTGLVGWLSSAAARAGGAWGGLVQPEQLTAPPAFNENATLDAFPILENDPPEPEPGHAWLKVPEGELRIFLGDRVQRFMPAESPSVLSPVIGADDYLRFVAFLGLGIVIGFQTPVVMLVLGWSGLVQADWLGKYRKYCLFACFALAALLTPGELVSMLLLALPLYALFELGLLLMYWVQRNRESPDAGEP